MGFSIDDILQTHGMGTGGNQNTGRIMPKTNRLTITQPTSSVVIPTSLAFRNGHDVLVVYVNQKYHALTADYTLSVDGKTVMKKIGQYDANTVFDFYVLTNIKDEIPTFDGALLDDGSIVESKLALEVREKLDATLQIGTLHQEFNILEAKTRVMREVTANTQLITEAGNLIASGTTLGGNGAYEFGLKPDRAETTTTVALAIGTVSLNGKVNESPFAVDDWVTIYDDVNMEDVRITAVATGILNITATTKAFKTGAAIKRTTMVPVPAGKGYTFPKWGTTQLDKGTIRFKIASTDEAVFWATRANDVTTTMSSYFTPGGVVNNVAGVTQNGTEIVETSPIGGGTTVDLLKVQNFHIGFRHPAGMSVTDFAVDSKKNVLVVGSTGSSTTAVKRFSPDGTLLWSNVETPNAILVAVAPDDSFYVAYNENIANGVMLRKFSASGVELWRKTRVNYTTGPSPGTRYGLVRSLGVAPNGDVILAMGSPDQMAHRYSASGDTIWINQVGSYDFMAIDPFGNFFLAAGSTLKKVGANGSTIWSIASGGNDEGAVSAIAADVFGNLVVGFDNYGSNAGDTGPRRFLKKFNGSGTLVWAIDSPSQFDRKEDSVFAVTTDVQGNILVFCDGMRTYPINFAKFDPAGNFVRMNEWQFTTMTGEKIVVVPDGTFYCKEYFNSSNVIHQFEPSFTEILPRPVPPAGKLLKLRDFTKTISFDKQGNSYWSDHRANGKDDWFDQTQDGNFYNLYKSDPDGNIIWTKSLPAKIATTACDSEGNVVIGLLSTDESLMKLDPDGKKIWGKTLYDYGWKVAIGPNDAVYVCYKYTEVQKFDKNGTLLATNLDGRYQGYYDQNNTFQYYFAQDFHVDSTGRVFMYRHMESSIRYMTSALVSNGTFPSFPFGIGTIYTSNPTNATVNNFTYLRHLFVDANDNLYLTEKGEVAKYNAAFVKQWQASLPYSRIVGSSGQLYGEITDIVADKSGIVYVVNPYLSQLNSYGEVMNGIRKLSKNGKDIGFMNTNKEYIAYDSIDLNPKQELVLGMFNWTENNVPTYFYHKKIGIAEKLKSWTIVEDNKTWYLRSTKNTAVTLTITIRSGDQVATETTTIPANETYRYVLVPEKFGIGTSTIRFAFDLDGYEEWAVSRTSDTLAITQFLVVTELAVQMQLQLNISRPNGSNSYLHKYLGGIG